MIRPTMIEVYSRMAADLSERSTCSRLRVGTVIASADLRLVLSIGYNGNAIGLPNCCDRDEPGNCGCLHSEENAIIGCGSPRSEAKIVIVTHSPCVMCAKRIINLGGVDQVYYRTEYRDGSSVDLLRSVGISVHPVHGGRNA
jgi:dCMP deaminase